MSKRARATLAFAARQCVGAALDQAGPQANFCGLDLARQLAACPPRQPQVRPGSRSAFSMTLKRSWGWSCMIWPTS
jgi:hypothetical protein